MAWTGSTVPILRDLAARFKTLMLNEAQIVASRVTRVPPAIRMVAEELLLRLESFIADQMAQSEFKE